MSREMRVKGPNIIIDEFHQRAKERAVNNILRSDAFAISCHIGNKSVNLASFKRFDFVDLIIMKKSLAEQIENIDKAIKREVRDGL